MSLVKMEMCRMRRFSDGCCACLRYHELQGFKGPHASISFEIHFHWFALDGNLS